LTIVYEQVEEQEQDRNLHNSTVQDDALLLQSSLKQSV